MNEIENGNIHHMKNHLGCSVDIFGTLAVEFVVHQLYDLSIGWGAALHSIDKISFNKEGTVQYR